MREKIEKKLIDDLGPEFLEVIDNSSLHKGHAGVDRDFDTHFLVRVKGGKIEGLSLVKSHRMINEILSDFFTQGLHSLQIEVIK